ncbi:MAG: class I SAM-dependent RNA methyltransferase [Planctomycetes bacterium]|nr:class I SAM-dependent RNA methyltransferase [Planctomycetota bacterium]
MSDAAGTPRLRVGDVLELEVERLAFGGDGVARHAGFVVFVPLAAPGERVRAELTELRPSFARARLCEVLRPSPDRRVPPCNHFGDCGGCQLQHLDHATQLRAKVGFVQSALERIGGIAWSEEIPIRSGAELGYRIRAQLQVAPRGAGRPPAVGFHRAGGNDVCDVASCPVLAPELADGLARLRALATDRSLPRVVQMAAGADGTATDPPLPGFATGALTQRVGAHVLAFTPGAFFQGNRALLPELCEQVAGASAGDFALDLFAGVGLFTLPLARGHARVLAVESDDEAVRIGRGNLARAGAERVELRRARVDHALRALLGAVAAGTEPRPDLVVLDPPRTGARSAMPLLVELAAPRVHYVSCDPPTLARDLRVLVAGGYRLVDVTAFDLFPQTYHVETVARLARTDPPDSPRDPPGGRR